MRTTPKRKQLCLLFFTTDDGKKEWRVGFDFWKADSPRGPIATHTKHKMLSWLTQCK